MKLPRERDEYDSALVKLSKLDAFPKVRDNDFFTRTAFGGVVTVMSSVFMVILFASELREYFITDMTHELFVDTSRGERMTIHFDITFPRLACSLVHVDAMDVGGDRQMDVKHAVYKTRLDASGEPIRVQGEPVGELAPALGPPKLVSDDNVTTYCGSCYGAETQPEQCCNTCDEVKEAYRKRGWQLADGAGKEQCSRENVLRSVAEQEGEGCHVRGELSVNKVAGNFHVAPGKMSSTTGGMPLVLQQWLGLASRATYDVSHVIHHLSFGTHFPGQKNPLDGAVRGDVQTTGSDVASGVHQYFIKVVPTVYETTRRGAVAVISSNQYSVTENYHTLTSGSTSMAGVYFFYDLSPIKVRFKERRRSTLLELVTSCFAIVGGVFTVAGLVDGFVYHGHLAVKKKLELGKLS